MKNIDYGLAREAAAIGRAERLRTDLWHRVREFFTHSDLLVTPTAAVPPFPLEVVYPTEINGKPMTNYIEWALLTYAFTVVGLPAISVPCGFTRAGLPVGLQIAGGWRDDARPCSAPRRRSRLRRPGPTCGRRSPHQTSLPDGSDDAPVHRGRNRAARRDRVED